MAFGLCLTEVHQEHRAAQALNLMDVRTILPKYKDPWRRIRLLFPRYLFVELLDEGPPWPKIAHAFYVKRLMFSGDHPARVPDAYMAELQAQIGPDGLVKRELHERFVPGQRIQILRGAFKDLIATYDGLSSKGREVVLLDFLGRKVPMEFAPSDLASA